MNAYLMTIAPINILAHFILYTVSVYINFYIVGFNEKNFNIVDKSNINNFKACLHHTLVTHTTVGFGDIYPVSDKAKLHNAIHISLVYLLLAGLVRF